MQAKRDLIEYIVDDHGKIWLIVNRDFIFEDKQIEYIIDNHGEVWFSAEMIGRALGYKNTADGINEIYRKHKEILDPYSRLIRVEYIAQTHTMIYMRYFSKEGVIRLLSLSNMGNEEKFLKFVMHQRCVTNEIFK